ncbi:MAG: hypothetical protein QF864_05475 [SAR202 cluster bacterium]|nr:hypothetical protein [SAR202 cluster bacterium]
MSEGIIGGIRVIPLLDIILISFIFQNIARRKKFPHAPQLDDNSRISFPKYQKI